MQLVKDGDVIGHESVEKARERHAAARRELPRSALRVSRGEPAIPTIMLDDDGDLVFNPYVKGPFPTNI